MQVPTKRFGLGWMIVAAMLLPAAPIAGDDTLTLREIMAQLEADLNRMTSAMMREGFETIAESAEAIGDHPEPGGREQARILGRLGADAPDFRAYDEAVHESAFKAVDAAEDRDLMEVYRYHRRIVESCLACHAEFKGRVRGTDP